MWRFDIVAGIHPSVPAPILDAILSDRVTVHKTIYNAYVTGLSLYQKIAFQSINKCGLSVDRFDSAEMNSGQKNPVNILTVPPKRQSRTANTFTGCLVVYMVSKKAANWWMRN